MNKILVRLTKKKEKTRITGIRNERGDINAHLMNIKRITKEYYKKFCDHKFDNQDEMDQFLETYNLAKFTKEEIHNLNRPIST